MLSVQLRLYLNSVCYVLVFTVVMCSVYVVDKYSMAMWTFRSISMHMRYGIGIELNLVYLFL